MSIPLVQDNDKNSINTSIIAIKRNLERINQLLGLSGSGTTVINNESDSGIPLGTWASFENDTPPSEEWLEAGATFNTSTYPALAMMLGGNTIPERFDHERLGDNEDVKTFFSTGGWNTNKIIPYDGFIEVSSYGTSNDSICYVNDIQIFRWYASGSINSSESYLIPVRKGDNVRFSASIDKVNARYYKHPMFIKATPTSSDSDYEGTLNSIREYYERNNTYSTEERLTGGKWIDGKPIYRRVLVYNNIPAYSDIHLLDTLTDYATIEMKRYEYYAHLNNSTKISSNYYSRRDEGGRDKTGVIYQEATGQLYVISYEAIKELNIIIEYTKTTD